jgi:hypothetical protein
MTLKDGIDVANRTYNDLNEEQTLNVTRMKFKFLGQVLKEIERNVNEIRIECECNERSCSSP